MRMIELLRRVLLVAGVFAAIAMLLLPAQAVWRVDIPDFAKDQKRQARTFGETVARFADEAGKTGAIENPYQTSLDAFIADRTKDRLLFVDPRIWSGFLTQAQGTLNGSSTALTRHLEDDSSPDHLYFAITQEPLATLTTKMGDAQPVLYLCLEGDETPRYLSVVFQRSHDAAQYAPAFIAYPWRHFAVWPFLFALAAYCLLPVRRPGARDYVYRQGNAVTMPDWLGLGLASLFFALPLLIIPSNASSLRQWSLLSMEDGWGILTLVLWAMSLLCLTNVIVGLWYSTFRIHVEEDGFSRETLFSSSQYAFGDVVAVESAVWTLPRWLKVIMVLLAMFNWRALGPVILGVTSSADGMRLRLRDGRNVNIWLSYMARPAELIGEFARRGIEIDAALLEKYEVDPTQPSTSTATVPPGVGLTRICVFTVLAVVTLSLTYWPATPRTIAAPLPEFSMERYARRGEILQEMKELHAQMTKGLTLIESATGESRDTAIRSQNSLMERFTTLQEEFDQLEQPASAASQ